MRNLKNNNTREGSKGNDTLILHGRGLDKTKIENLDFTMKI